MGWLSKLIGRDASVNVETFASAVVKDGKTGAPISLAPMHREMLRMWTSQRASVIWGHPESGKTTMKNAWLLYELGRRPDTTIIIAGATAGMAERRIRTLMQAIETSPELHAIFPKLKPGTIWSKEGFSIAGRPTNLVGPSVVAASPEAQGFLGTRADIIDQDDVCTRENTRTKEACEELWAWYLGMLRSRSTSEPVNHATGMVWSAEDLLHRLAQQRGWTSRRFPLLDSDGRSSWPERWPEARIEEFRQELGPVSFARTYLCETIPEGALVFSAADLQRASRRGIENPNYASKPPGRYVIGVDPAFSTGEHADLSAYVVICETDELHRVVIECGAGRWSFDETKARIIERAQYYKASVAIESNSGGKYMADDVAKKVPAKPYNTNVSTKAARIDWLSAELAANRWTFNARNGAHDPEIQALISELTMFSPNTHSGDRAMALMVGLEHLRSLRRRWSPQDSSRLSHAWTNRTVFGGSLWRR